MVPLFYAYMKFFGAFLTEIVNILLLCSQNTVMDCVLNFIALGVISEIDNMYYDSLKHAPLKKALEEPPKKKKDGIEYDKTLGIRFFQLIYEIFSFVYRTYYYYFMAFTAVFLTLFFGEKV